MNDVIPFGAIVAVASAVGVLAVLANRVSERLRIPAPAFFLIGSAVAATVVPSLSFLTVQQVQRIVTVALAVILFDGGMHLGVGRLRGNAAAVVWLGVAGTVVTALALAVAGHVLFGFGWRVALLVGTALAPTDPAVVFSVLGRREVPGRSGVLLEGESGANDPVGIALMASLISAGAATGTAAVWHGLGVFVLQMAIGAAVGLLGGRGLLTFVRRVPLPSQALYPVQVLAAAGLVYGTATIAHGSGFLAVFVAGIVVGDAPAPYKEEIERFHSSLASLGEIVAFTVLGLTVSLRTLADGDAGAIGLALALLLTLVVRPLFVGVLLWPVRLQRAERVFVLGAGLKGAVPVLLGTFILTAGVADATRYYHIVVVVVAFSVIVQGGLVPAMVSRLRS